MHDHLRDLGREMALDLSSPHRLWCPRDLKHLELNGFRNVLTQRNVRCFHSIFDESMNSQVTFFLAQSNSYFEKSASVLWLQLEGNNKELPSIPSWIPLHKLQSLKIKRGRLRTLWENRIQAPSQLKELHITQTSLKEFPDFQGMSDNLDNVFLDAQGLPIQGLSLLESLSMNLSSICLRFSTLKGEWGYSERGGKTLCKSLVIENFKFHWEVDWNNEKAHMRGLEKIEINGEEFVSKILISGIHYPSLTSIKLHYMENLMEVDLTKVKTLNCLDIRNCQKLKRLVVKSDLANLVLLNISQCPELERITIEHCEHSKNVSGISNPRNPVESKDHYLNGVAGVSSFRKLAQLYITECPELEELSLAHLIWLEKITIVKCCRLKSVSGISNLEKLLELEFSDCEKLGLEYLRLSGMKCLEKISFGRNMMLKYFELDGCQNLKSAKFFCEKLVELRIQGCLVLEVIPEFVSSNCLKRIIIDGCAKLARLHVQGCHNLKSVSGKFESRFLSIVGCHELQGLSGIGDVMELKECPELEELPSLFGLNNMEKFVVYDCEKIKRIILPPTLNMLDIRRCRDLQSVAGTSDLMELRELFIIECPELEEFPSLSTVNNMEKFAVYDCEKIKRIILPPTLNMLDISRCRDLQRVAGTSDLMELRKLIIYDCPELEGLQSLSTVNNMEEFLISDCEKIKRIILPPTLNMLNIRRCRDLQRVEGTSDIYMTLRYCSKALTWNCIQKLKSVPSGLLVIGRAEDGTESSLNDLFCEANIDVDGVIEIGTGESDPEWSEFNEAVIRCYVVVVDSSTSLENVIKESLSSGESIITMGARDDRQFITFKENEDLIMRNGIVKKGVRAEVEKGEEWKRMGVLSTILERLCHYD